MFLAVHNLVYLDDNNLYGWAMSQSLPTHGFRFLQQKEISTLKLQYLFDDDEDGYIFEVDRHYPSSLHNQRDDYPLVPESLVIDRSMYSPIQHCISRNFHPICGIKSSMLFITVT